LVATPCGFKSLSRHQRAAARGTRTQRDDPRRPPMNFCSQCGQPVSLQVPAGDNRPRHVCGSCGHVHYQNPLIVVGCVPEFRGEILLCRRAIEPRRGFWTVPAGFMEIGETLAEGAIRETWEEAEAQVELGALFAIVDVVQARQVHVFFPRPAARAGLCCG
jgi:ribosomal protein S27AE